MHLVLEASYGAVTCFVFARRALATVLFQPSDTMSMRCNLVVDHFRVGVAPFEHLQEESLPLTIPILAFVLWHL